MCCKSFIPFHNFLCQTKSKTIKLQSFAKLLFYKLHAHPMTALRPSNLVPTHKQPQQMFSYSLRCIYQHFDTHITLLSVRTQDGGGIEVFVVPFDERSEASTFSISIYDSGSATVSHRLLVSGGCDMLPRVWYHLAVRHTRVRPLFHTVRF